MNANSYFNTSIHPKYAIESPDLNINKNESKDTYNDVFEITKQITGLYLMPFISIFGILGNILIVIVYQRSQKYSTNLYLIVLSLSDILKLSNDFLYFIVNFTNKIDRNLSEKIFNSLYLYSHYIFIFTAINTSWLTCTIALDRYITVAKNRAKQPMSNYLKSTWIAIALLMTSAFISIPSPLFLATVNEFDTHANKTVVKVTDSRLNRTNFRIIYNYLTALVRAFIPLILLICLNFRILRIVYQNKIKKKATSGVKSRKSKSSVTAMLFTIILTFTLCMFPDAIMTMMQFGYANETFMVKSIREVTDLLLAINSAITFPICFYFSIEFRSKIKRLCCDNEKIGSMRGGNEIKSSKTSHVFKKLSFLKENEKLKVELLNENHSNLALNNINNKTELTDIAAI